MGDKQRWPIAQARPVAEALREMLAPACERIEIAGSIRRGKPDVGDIELLCISKALPSNADLFGNVTGFEPELDHLCLRLIQEGVLDYRLNVRGHRTFGAQNKLLVHRESGIPLDVFTTTKANWGMAMVVRTGPADYNVQLMARFKQLGMSGHAYGGVSKNGRDLACPTEEDVFRLAQRPNLPPEKRA